MDPSKIVAVTSWPVPHNLKEVHSFIGLCAWYRELVQNFSALAAPLHALTRKGRKFVSTGACQETFELLRTKLVTAPVLTLPIDEGQFVLDVDALDLASGSVLSQEQGGQERVVEFFSQKHYGTE